MQKFNVGILGATGMVGQRFISLLHNHPWFDISVLAASSRSAGKTYVDAVGERWAMECKIPQDVRDIVVLDAVNDMDKIVSKVDFVFCAVDMSKEDILKLEEDYAKAECPVISNNSAHRFTDDVPMIIPEINPFHCQTIIHQRERLGTNRGFIAVKSNCSLQSYVPAISPLREFGVTDVLVCTYQAVSGAGKTLETWPDMYDNVIPFIGGEEEKSEKEPLKIWGKVDDGKIVPSPFPRITAQCFRVPVSDGHSAAVFVSFEEKPSVEQIIERWDNFISYSQTLGLPSSPKKFLYYFPDDNQPQIKYARNLENGMAISIGRLREDSIFDYKFVCMSHNTIRGAAGGAVLMAEFLCHQGFMDR